ncbi:MAG: hypothetical protein KDL87_01220 [Verrucomicrobiae bacterium]|nr:hypothetical protein [Verrucomicrobiae bacterium]
MVTNLKSTPAHSSPAIVGSESDALSASERSELEKCEQTIRRFFMSFLEVGEALEAIRDGRLYRERCANFEGYCRDNWGFTRQRAHQLIEASKIADFLSTNVDTWPSNEAQVRPLVGLPYEKAGEAWELAVTLAGKKDISGRIVKQAVDAIREDDSGRAKEKLRPPKAVTASPKGADGSTQSAVERDGADPSPDLGVEEPELEVVLTPQEAPEKDSLPGIKFELADGSWSEEYRFNGEDDLLSAGCVESKLRSTQENNSKAPQRLREKPEVMALRQEALLKLAFVVNQIAGTSPSIAERDQLYWAIEDLRHLTAFMLPVTQPNGEEEVTADA